MTNRQKNYIVRQFNKIKNELETKINSYPCGEKVRIISTSVTMTKKSVRVKVVYNKKENRFWKLVIHEETIEL